MTGAERDTIMREIWADHIALLGAKAGEWVPVHHPEWLWSQREMNAFAWGYVD